MSILTNYRKPKGATLTEVLFSAVIISLVMVSIVLIFVQTVDISKRIDYEYTATNLAKNRLERARTLITTSGFDFLSDLGETDTVIDEDGAADTEGDFKRSTLVSTNYSGDARQTYIATSVIYKYKNEWRGNAVTTMVTIFTNPD